MPWRGPDPAINLKSESAFNRPGASCAGPLRVRGVSARRAGWSRQLPSAPAARSGSTQPACWRLGNRGAADSVGCGELLSVVSQGSTPPPCGAGSLRVVFPLPAPKVGVTGAHALRWLRGREGGREGGRVGNRERDGHTRIFLCVSPTHGHRCIDD